MYDENLGNSVIFMIDAILTDEREYRDIETELMDAALRIEQCRGMPKCEERPSLRHVSLCCTP